VPQRSKIELLGLVEAVIAMYYTQGLRQQEIANRLAAQGYQISKASVGRAIKSYAKRLRDVKKKQDWAEALTAETKNTARLDVAGAGLQIAAAQLLEEVSNIETSDFEAMTMEEKITLLTKVTRAIGLASSVELNFERGRKQGIIESRNKIEAAAKELGVSDEVVAKIRAKIIGLSDKNGSNEG
jgi:arginine repressor